LVLLNISIDHFLEYLMPTPSSPAEATLIAALKETLGNVYVMYLRAHAAHWNVEGPLFASLHDFFGDIYQDVFSSVDMIAEGLRQHDVYAPFNLSQMMKLSTIADATFVFEGGAAPSPLIMDLYTVNEAVRVSLGKTQRAAEIAGDLGLANFFQDRLAMHQKWMWQLKAHLGLSK
jgi:starvation-inducible DNA-binding protein